MEFSTRPELTQTQQLSMTPQLLQAISLLALPSTALADIVAAEMESNPLLKWANPESVPVSSFQEPIPATSPPSTLGNRVHSSRFQKSTIGSSPLKGSTSHSDFSMDDIAHPGDLALREHLIRQLDLSTSDPGMRTIGRTLIDALDSAGYLTEPLADLQKELNCSEKEILYGLKLVQSLEPVGVGARNLRECLLLQLQDREQNDAATLAVLERLDLVAKRDWETLRTVTKLSQNDIIQAVKHIASVNPKPGLAFSQSIDPIREPDAFIKVLADDSLVIELNANLLPCILVDKDLQIRVSSSIKNNHEKAFLQDCATRAQWLKRTLEQRAETLLKVLKTIAEHQESFFKKGWVALRPLNLKDVAGSLELHESTISRIITNKTLATPFGVHSLKSFFSNAVPSAEGRKSISAKAVAFRIKHILTEGALSSIPLSDEKIASLLREDGIMIARRTVAKYRKQLRLPSSVGQRRQKKPLK